MSKRIVTEPAQAAEHSDKCFARHMGIWSVEPMAFQQAYALAKDGLYQAEHGAGSGGERVLYTVDDGLGIIDIIGFMMKGESSMGDSTNTVQVRRAIRQAVADKDVQAIVMFIDSPGGSAAGSAELATEIARATTDKTVVAHIEDIGASAAYFAASQATIIASNRSAIVGSIGTMAVLVDSSGAAKADGVKVHILKTGDFKGVGTEGGEITKGQLAHYQTLIEGLNVEFFEATARGRNMTVEAVADLEAGIFVAEEAKAKGLVDVIRSFEDTLDATRAEFVQQGTPRRNAAGRRMKLGGMG